VSVVRVRCVRRRSVGRKSKGRETAFCWVRREGEGREGWWRCML